MSGFTLKLVVGSRSRRVGSVACAVPRGFMAVSTMSVTLEEISNGVFEESSDSFQYLFYRYTDALDDLFDAVGKRLNGTFVVVAMFCGFMPVSCFCVSC
jgi:hypothetical protein